MTIHYQQEDLWNYRFGEVIAATYNAIPTTGKTRKKLLCAWDFFKRFGKTPRKQKTLEDYQQEFKEQLLIRDGKL